MLHAHAHVSARRSCCNSNAGRTKTSHGVRCALCKTAQMAQTYHAEFAPVCAVMGGLIASEVIKLISGKERPINNCLFYDGATSDAMVQRLGPSFDTSWGIDRGEFQPLSARRAE